MPFFFRRNCLCILFICADFYHVGKCYIEFQGAQGRQEEQKLANKNQEHAS